MTRQHRHWSFACFLCNYYGVVGKSTTAKLQLGPGQSRNPLLGQRAAIPPVTTVKGPAWFRMQQKTYVSTALVQHQAEKHHQPNTSTTIKTKSFQLTGTTDSTLLKVSDHHASPSVAVIKLVAPSSFPDLVNKSHRLVQTRQV